MSTKVIDTIQGIKITLNTDDTTGAEEVDFTADMDVDCDGIGGNPFHDPYFQLYTRLKFRKRSLHAEVVPFVVVPPSVIRYTKGRVLGSLVVCTNLLNGKKANAVVGDSGPRTKIGEGSPALCELLGLDPNPNHGGTSDKIIHYKIFVEVPAKPDTLIYDLQSA